MIKFFHGMLLLKNIPLMTNYAPFTRTFYIQLYLQQLTEIETVGCDIAI